MEKKVANKKVEKKKVVVKKIITKIDGEEYVFDSVPQLEEGLRDAARQAGYNKYDVKDTDIDMTIAPDEIKLGGSYAIVPRAVAG